MSARTLGCWVHTFNDRGSDGLINTPPTGRPSKLSATQKQEIGETVEAGPDPEVDGVVRWRCVDLKAIIRKRYAVDLDKVTVSRLLKELGFAHVSARPQHPRQDPEAIEAFKKALPERITEITETLDADTRIELWFQDEMRIGPGQSHINSQVRTYMGLCHR